MERVYKVQITYPSGKVELIEEDFLEGKEALEYGNSMLAQIAQTERFHSGLDEDVLGDHKKQEAYFIIIEVKGKKENVVFDSRFPR